MTEPWLSADDIASHLGVTKDTVYTWIADKSMPAHKIGRLWKFQAPGSAEAAQPHRRSPSRPDYAPATPPPASMSVVTHTLIYCPFSKGGTQCRAL